MSRGAAGRPRRRAPALAKGCALALLAAALAPAGAAPNESALDQLASRAADALRAQGAAPPVALHVRADSPELARAFATVLAARLAAGNLAPISLDAPTAAAAEAEARSRGARSLARLTVSVEGGLVHARGDLLGTWVNFWSGASATRPQAPAAGVEISAHADAQALALAATAAPRPPPGDSRGELQLTIAPFARLPRWTAALAAGDLDGDGRDEVLALTDEALVALAPDGKLRARRELSALPLSPSQSREPFGAVAVDAASRQVSYLSAQRARGEVLALDPSGAGFRAIAAAENAPLARAANALVEGSIVAGQNTFAPKISGRGAAAWTAPRPFTTLSAFAGPSGVEILVVHPGGESTLRRGLSADAPTVSLRGLGAATALADLDGDGAPELATTEPAFEPAPEVLRVLSLSGVAAGQEPQVRSRRELSRGRALQIAPADLDGDGVDELVIALWMPDGTSELHVARRAP